MVFFFYTQDILVNKTIPKPVLFKKIMHNALVKLSQLREQFLDLLQYRQNQFHT